MKKKKKRKNKSIVALHQKRKSFAGLFIRRWIAVLMLSVVGLIFAKDIFVRQKQDEWKNTYYWAKDTILEVINNGPQDESYEMYINRIEFLLAGKQEVRTASLLCNAETGEIIADCKEKIFITKKRDGQKSLIYSCPTEDIEGWDEYRKKFVENKDSSYHLSEDMEMDYIYVNGTGFIPGSFKITNRPYDIETGEYIGDFSMEALVTEFEEPKDLSSEYVRTELNDDWMTWFAWGYNVNDTTLYSGSHEGYMELQRAYQEFVDTGSTFLGGEFYTEQKMILSESNKLIMPNGEKAVLMTVYYYDVWDDYGTWEIVAVIITFIAGFLLSLIWAKLSYTKLKAQYDMEDYRKTLMNTMAHDLKSPLMSISGYAENLQNNINSDKKDHYAEAILGNVNYMNHLIESILSFNKTEQLDISGKKERTNIKSLICECSKKYDMQMKERKLTMEVEGDISLNVDSLLFAQVMDNLIGNAVKFADEESCIKVVLNEKYISISNQYHKDIDVDMSKLSEPFVVGNENRSDKCGNGLGLAIVNNICMLHKFSLELKCEENMFIASINNVK